MPLNVGRYFTFVFLVLSAFITAANAQQAAQSTPVPSPESITKAPTAAEVMRSRIDKAKAFIAVRNYYAAINELENIRRETSDQSVIAVTNVLLMKSYLEQGDHKKAQDLLNQFFNEQKTTKKNALENYGIVAGQIIKSARNQAERYRSLGLSVNDRNLPLEALNDLEKMRATVETVITHAKEMSADKSKESTALMLMEEATNARVAISRDDYDARRWRDAVADSREQMAVSRSVVINAVDGTSTPVGGVSQQAVAANVQKEAPTSTAIPAAVNTTNTADTKPAPSGPSAAPVVPQAEKPKPSETAVAAVTKPEAIQPEKKAEEAKAVPQPERPAIVVGGQKPVEAGNKVKATSSSRPTGPVEVGSLLPYAERQATPTYPPAARSMRASGVVKVEVTIDEEGNVEEVNDASGPALLQASAKDAIRKWKFRPFMIDGQAVKATGFVNFNFSL